MAKKPWMRKIFSAKSIGTFAASVVLTSATAVTAGWKFGLVASALIVVLLLIGHMISEAFKAFRRSGFRYLGATQLKTRFVTISRYSTIEVHKGGMSDEVEERE